MQIGSGFIHFNREQSALDFLSHPAVLAHVHRTGFAVSYGFPFQLQSLNHYSVSTVFPFKSIKLGTAFSAVGKEVYRETTFSLGGGYSIGDNMSFGILINGHELSIRNYGSDRTVGIVASVNYSFTKSMQWSLLYRNLNSPKLGVSREPLPQVVATVFGFSPTPSLLAAVELERDLEFESRYKFGIRWQPIEALRVATGFVSHPTQVTAGISLQVKGLFSISLGKISYAIVTHPELAISQVFALHITLP